MNTGTLCCRFHFFLCGGRSSYTYIIPNGCVKEKNLLLYHRKIISDVTFGEFRNILSSQSDSTYLGLPEPHHQTCQRGFSRPGFAHDSSMASSRKLKTNIFQRIVFLVGIGECNMLETNFRLCRIRFLVHCFLCLYLCNGLYLCQRLPIDDSEMLECCQLSKRGREQSTQYQGKNKMGYS